MSAVCLAVIAKENYPLYVKCSGPDEELKFQYLVHTSLDVIEEKVAAQSPARGGSDLRELYLGQLYPTEEYKIYGYMTNTKVKFVAVVENTNSYGKDSEMKNMFKTLHTAYGNLLSNSFYTPGDQITSKAFGEVVDKILRPSAR
ncbi:trafficking protein particle complex subunit 2-like protein isoform X2 [Oscarella lobularis]|uniref:trafficking protein particle complex subunit 2-like protein isoform X2 n=1 Tax=Oscarella lobularis TaxID=121494 RepID=UPI003313DFFD